jgi:hypothetical protein
MISRWAVLIGIGIARLVLGLLTLGYIMSYVFMQETTINPALVGTNLCLDLDV